MAAVLQKKMADDDERQPLVRNYSKPDYSSPAIPAVGGK